jgi:hypothetical protein
MGFRKEFRLERSTENTKGRETAPLASNITVMIPEATARLWEASHLQRP